MSRLDEAEEYYSKTISLKPDGPGAYIAAGQFFAAKDKASEALDTFRKGLRLFPDNPLLHANYGIVLKKQGYLDRAAKEFTTTIELDPTNAMALKEKKELEKAVTEEGKG